jgi:hypothetical protein
VEQKVKFHGGTAIAEKAGDMELLRATMNVVGDFPFSVWTVDVADEVSHFRDSPFIHFRAKVGVGWLNFFRLSPHLLLFIAISRWQLTTATSRS